MRPLAVEGGGQDGGPQNGSDLLQSHLEAVLSSESFAGAWRQRRLLTYLIEKHLQGRSSEIKEYSLGVEVFDKGEEFDPRLDPIVRVEASRLRQRLQKYYESEGSSAPIRIELPRGSYVPRIVERDAAAIGSPTLGEGESGQATPSPSAARIHRLPLRTGVWLGALAVGVAAWLIYAGSPGRVGGSAFSFTRITREQVRSNSPSFSPDGSFLVYARREGENWDLFLRRVATGETRNLTAGSPSDDRQPACSPDGKWVAFRSEREGGGIFLLSLGDGSVRRLSTFGYHPSWSPDGRRIVFSSDTFAEPEDGPARRASVLHVVDLASGAIRPLTSSETVYDAVQPAWSPNGHRIAFWGSGPDGKRDLWTIPVSEGEPARVRPVPVTQDAWIDWSPAWSADGTYLYFTSDRDGSMNIWRIRIDELSGEVRGQPEPLRTPSTYSTHPAPSADGKAFAYTQRVISSTLHAAPFRPVGEVDLSASRQLTSSGRQVREPEVSPDGQWLSARIQDPEEDIILMRPDGSGMRRLTDDKFKDRNARWFPDGSSLLFLSNRGGTFEYWMIRPDGSGLRRAAPSMLLTWRPDGYLVGYPSNGIPQCIEPRGTACPADGLPGEFLPAVWSRDGRRVAGRFRSSSPPREELVIYSLADRSYWKVTDHGWSPVWLNDGRRLLYWEANQIWLADTAARQVRPVLAPPRGVLQQRFTLSADQRTIFYVLTEAEEDIWLARRQ